MPALISLLLSQGLPLIANLFLSKGTEFVKDKTGVDLSLDSIMLSPQDKAALAKYQMDNAVALAQLQLEDNKLDLQYFQAETADAASARQREASIAQASPAPWWVPSFTSVLAIIVIVGGGVLLTMPTFQTDGRMTAIVSIMTMVLSYYFGAIHRGSNLTAATRASDNAPPSVTLPIPAGSKVTTQVAKDAR